jgi:hypothetical protein
VRLVDKKTDKHNRTEEDLNNAAAKTMERVDETEWIRGGHFWGITIEQVKSTGQISLPEYWGLDDMHHEGIYPYQMVESYQLYFRGDGDDNGGLFCNMMGMGKTVSVQLLLVLDAAHRETWFDVREAIKNRDNFRHNVPGMPQLGEDGACPSRRERPFRCVCDPKSELFNRTPRLAPTIISGWGIATKAWVDEYEKLLSRSKWVDPQRVRHPIRFCWMQANVSKLCPRPTKEELLEMQTTVDFDALLMSHNYDHQTIRTYTSQGQIVNESPKWRYHNPQQNKNHPDSTRDRPAPSSGRFFLIANHNTFQNRIVNLLSNRKFSLTRTIIARGRPKAETKDITASDLLVIGRTIYDEFHNAKNATTQFAKLYTSMRKSNKGYQWKSLAMSGTPLETGLAETLVFITLALNGLVDPATGMSNWSEAEIDPNTGKRSHVVKKDIYFDVSTKNGMEQAKLWMKMAKNSTSQAKGGVTSVLGSAEYKDAVVLGTKILKHFMIRRTLKTRNPWGEKISAIKGTFKTLYRPLVHPDWTTTVDDARQRIYDAMFKDGSAGNSRDTTSVPDAKGPELDSIFDRFEMIAYATYPGLATLRAAMIETLGPDDWGNFSSSQIDAYVTNPLQAGPFMDNRDLILEGSAKFNETVRICSEVQRSTRKNPEVKRDSQAPPQLPAKILIGSVKPIVTLMTYLGLVRDFGKDCVEYMPGGLTAREKNERQANWKRANGPFILVASIGAFAESITLTEANHVIILEPQDRMNKQDQFLFRVFRIGQLEEITYGYLFYNPDAQAELALLSKQNFKKVARSGVSSEAESASIVQGKTVDWKGGHDVEYLVDGL